MNKRYAHHLLTRLRILRYRYLVAVLLVCLTVFVFSYRQNNLDALRLREELIEVDKQNGDVEAALKRLREFTYGHMNADLSASDNAIYPPIQLKYRYERLVQAEQARVEQANQQLYTDAQNYCEERIISGRTIQRVPCIQEYLASRSTNAVTTVIPDALYKFDFVSPLWSPDLAGWSLIASLLVGLLLVTRGLTDKLLRHRLKQ